MTEDLTSLLICPEDRQPLIAVDGGFRARASGAVYRREGHIVDFLGSDDAFYEGKYANAIRINPKPGLWHEWPLWLLVHGYVWAVRKYAQPGGVMVELGCAGGVRWFGSRFRMIGIDLARYGLVSTGDFYELGIRGNALRVPLADASVDAVVSSCFFEHIAPADKPQLLAEMFRILKPGGRLIFQYDIETANPLIAAYRDADPERYQREFLDGDGHIGYQTLAANNALFAGAGFRIRRSVALERTALQPSSVYLKLGQWPGLRGRLARLAGRLLGGVMVKPNMALLRIIDESVGRLFPERWGRIALTVAEKPVG